MYRIVTPTCTLHALTHCSGYEVDVADLNQRGAAEVQKGCWIHASIGRTGDHPLSHSNAENFFGGRPIEQQKRAASPSGWGNYFWSEGVEKSDTMFLSPAHYPRHSPQQTPPHSCPRTTGEVTTVHNALHGLPEKRKRELCEKLGSTTVVPGKWVK